MRLIDADEMKKMLDIETLDGQRIAFFIDEQPTIDAVEVVRCRDCECYEPLIQDDDGDGQGIGKCHGHVVIIPTKPNYYCSYGERKEE